MNRRNESGAGADAIADVLNATIIERRDLNDELSIIRVAPDDGDVPDFKPGQFCTLGLPKDRSEINPNSPAARRGRAPMIRRAYSIASSPAQKDALELYVVLVEHGKLTTKLWELEKGDRLYLDPRINGHFTLDRVGPGKDVVMISTGTGLAPFVSMLRAEHPPERFGRRVVLHGVRYERDLGYREELEAMAAADPSVIYIPAVTREAEGSKYTGHRGRVTSVLDDHVFEPLTGFPLDAATTEVMLCGNPAMIESVRTMLEPKGFVEHTEERLGNLHFERYW